MEMLTVKVNSQLEPFSDMRWCKLTYSYSSHALKSEYNNEGSSTINVHYFVTHLATTQ